MKKDGSESQPFAAFVTTRWTSVLAARGKTPDSKIALQELCAAYYAPVELFIRFQVPGSDCSRDLAHDFFTGILSGDSLLDAQQDKGRFRSYLLGAVKHFLADVRARESSLKRGGGAEILPLYREEDGEPAHDVPDCSKLSPDEEYDCKWALTVVDRALLSLEREHDSVEKQALFQTLKPWLVGDAQGLSQAEAAERLGIGEGNVRVAIHRLRKRFRECVKLEIMQTLDDPAQVEAELKELQSAIGRRA